MADILTLAQARAALNWPASQYHDRDAELAALYLPAATAVVESVCGRMVDRRESWRTDAPSPITTPWPTATIRRVSLGQRDITGWSFASGVLTITDPAYTAGDEVTVTATGLPTPAPVLIAAGIILAQMWNADHQGRPQGGSVIRGEATETVPVGFAVPRRAEALMAPYAVPGGFA